MIKDLEQFNKIISNIEKELKQLKQLNVEDQMEGQLSLEIDSKEIAKQVIKSSKTTQINDLFENCWKLIPSTQWDSKKRVTKDTKVRLYDYGYELTRKACELYLNTQKVEYRYKRDKFFNEIIWNYLDMVEEEDKIANNNSSNFNFKGF